MELKHKITGYIIRSAAYAVLLSCAIVGFSSAFVSPGNDSKLRGPSQSALRASGQSKTLTFADRVAYQRAIEVVYWRHRIWPKGRRDPKPSLHAVMSQAQIEKKVQDYLRDSQALKDYWQTPITPEQLQAEMDRIAHHTKQPQVLREIFQALGDDPFVIAECLARPVLAQRLISELNNGDRAMPTRIARLKAVQVNRPYQLPAISSPSGGCIDDTWTATSLTNAPSARSGHTAVWTGTEMIVWGGTNNPPNYFNTGGKYNPSTDSWMPTSTTNAPQARSLHTAVWTGSEMIVWGGWDGSTRLNTGGRYNPGTDSWTATSTTNAPSVRWGHTAVWTGSEMIIWAGLVGPGTDSNTGGRYNPSTDSWTATSTTNAAGARFEHTAVWIGTEMIVWGGYDFSINSYLNTGGRYNPSTDSWIATTITNAPTARAYPTAVWTDSEMIVWGGLSDSSFFSSGGRYDPGMDSWTATSTINAPTARAYHTAIWTDTEMIVWGGLGIGPTYFSSGGRYNPSTDSWTATSTTNAPSARDGHTAVWTRSEMIVWGGYNGSGYFSTGGRYCAQSGPTPTPSPTATATATATATPTGTPTTTPSPTPRATPTPRPRPTPAPRPSP